MHTYPPIWHTYPVSHDIETLHDVINQHNEVLRSVVVVFAQHYGHWGLAMDTRD